MKTLLRLSCAALVVASLLGYRYVGKHGTSVITASTGRPRPAGGPASLGEWPRWRGPLSNGISATARPPQRWSESDGIRWKVAVPGRGHSSPVVCGEQIILSTADDEEQTISVFCHRRKDGAALWSTPIQRGALETPRGRFG